MPTNKELELKLNKLTDVVMTLAENLKPKEEVKAEPKSTAITLTNGNALPKKFSNLTPEEKINKVLGGKSNPIPQDYRDAVDELLNKDFGIHVLASTGVPSFRFSILVPKKYSKEEDHDIRSKMLSFAEGEGGVRMWCDTILQNFDEETRGRIIKERTTNDINI